MKPFLPGHFLESNEKTSHFVPCAGAPSRKIPPVPQPLLITGQGITRGAAGGPATNAVSANDAAANPVVSTTSTTTSSSIGGSSGTGRLVIGGFGAGKPSYTTASSSNSSNTATSTVQAPAGAVQAAGGSQGNGKSVPSCSTSALGYKCAMAVAGGKLHYSRGGGVPNNNCTNGTSSNLGGVAEEQMLHFAFEAQTQVPWVGWAMVGLTMLSSCLCLRPLYGMFLKGAWVGPRGLLPSARFARFCSVQVCVHLDGIVTTASYAWMSAA